MKLSLGFSPCPNDTFIFNAMVNGKMDTSPYKFDLTIGDVEELNQLALKAVPDITKISYHTYAYVTEHYQLLNAGSALGENCGPLLIAKKGKEIPTDLANFKVAIPGKFTTANFLLSIAYPTIKNKQDMLFSEIENAVLNDEVDAGLIIHENRFTYQEKGLKKIKDLGKFWEDSTQMPIPLGGIAIKRSLPDTIKQEIDFLLKTSVVHAFENATEKEEFVLQHAQEMDSEVLKKHIDLYVNQYTKDLGKRGRTAVSYMLKRGQELGVVKDIIEPIFID